MLKKWIHLSIFTAMMMTVSLLQLGCPPGTVNVPDISGLTVAQATTALNDVGLVMGTETREFHPSLDEDLIIESSPGIGSEVESGSTVNVVVSNGNVIFVDEALENKGATIDGLSWDTAYWTLQPAIDFVWSNDGGEVWVSKGTYNEVRDGNTTGSLRMYSGVDIYGGFNAADKGTGDTFPAVTGTPTSPP